MIYTIHHRKGGVGKTTLTQHLAAAASLAGHKTLIIDADGQSNLTRVSGLEPEAFAEKCLGSLISASIGPNRPNPQSWVFKLTNTLDILPNSPKASDVAEQQIAQFDGRRELFIAKILQALEKDYQLILIDTGPGRDWLTRNSLLAADRILVPVQMERLSAEGLIDLTDFIGDLGRRYLEEETPLGVYKLIPSLFNGQRKRHRILLSGLREMFPDLISQTSIRHDAEVEHAQNENTSVLVYNPRSRAAQDYTSLALELLA